MINKMISTTHNPILNTSVKNPTQIKLPGFWSSSSEAKSAHIVANRLLGTKSMQGKARVTEEIPSFIEQASESVASKRLHKLIYCDSRLQQQDSRLANDWNLNRQRLLTELDTLLGDPPTVHHSHRGHLLLVHQLLEQEPPLSAWRRTRSNRMGSLKITGDGGHTRHSRQHQMALKLLQQIGSFNVPVAAPLEHGEHGFLETMLSIAEITHAESFLHQPPINQSAKRATHSFNTLSYTLHHYLSQCVCDLRNKKGKKRYRTTWRTLREDPHLRAQYHHFLRCWSEFTHLYLLEKTYRCLSYNNANIHKLLRSVVKEWSGLSGQEKSPVPEFFDALV